MVNIDGEEEYIRLNPEFTKILMHVLFLDKNRINLLYKPNVKR